MSDLEATRRGAIGAMAAAGALAASGVVQTAEAQSARKTFVLVHGAWHGGWCWRRVADRLEAKGHKVYAQTLTGLCDRAHLLTKDTNVGTHASDIANLIKWEELSDIVLVGHSYGGFVITEVAERAADRIASIVYLDAFVPEPGQSLLDLASPTARKLLEEAIARGDLAVKPIPAAVFNVNEKDRAWVDAQCTPQPSATFAFKTTGIAGRNKVARKSYIRAASYKSPSFDAGLAKAKGLGWRTFEVPSGHDVMVDMPDRLTEILLEVA
jgi:pimeloyl-ACP methyl ester carboxylesterase